jgi:hypothetical protein
MKAGNILLPVLLPPFEGMPDTVPDGTDANAVPPETGSGTWGCCDCFMGLIVYRHSTGVYGRLRYTPGTGRVVGFIWGSEIQPTFSLRTSHNAHTAGIGQQVADYVAEGCVYARVGCQQNPLFVKLCRCRSCSAAWLVTRRKLPVGFTALLQLLGCIGIIDIFDYYLNGFGSGSPD